MYDKIPASLKSELLVRSVQEDPELLKDRQQLVQSMSVSELAKVGSLSDFPIPDTIENLLSGKSSKAKDHDRCTSPGSQKGEGGIYATLPRSLTQELAVKTEVRDQDEEMKHRQELVRSKSPAELGAIHSFSEIPIPSFSRPESKMSPKGASKSAHELGEGRGIYDTLPKSLKEPLLVKQLNEDPELQKERSELTKSKTPGELGDIRGFTDIPLPGLWQDKGNTMERARERKKREKAEKKERSKSQGGDKFGTLPSAMNKHCVVRCTVEDPEVLRHNQELQQSKSIHELSKIGNINQFPLPFNMPLPDIPLPKPTKIFKMLARTPSKKKKGAPVPETSPSEAGYSPSSSPLSPDRTDDELLR